MLEALVVVAVVALALWLAFWALVAVTPPESLSPKDAEEAARQELVGYIRIGDEAVEVVS